MILGNKEISFVLANKQKVLDTLCEFVLTDTILYCDEAEVVSEQQRKELAEVLRRVNLFLGTSYESTYGFEVKEINCQQKKKILSYFESVSNSKLTLIYMVALKLRSVLLAILFAEEEIDSYKAMNLALYEEISQQNKWGLDEEQKLTHQKLSEEMKELENIAHEGNLSEN